MKTRFLIIAALVFFSLSPSALAAPFAISCGTGGAGTCKSACVTGETSVTPTTCGSNTGGSASLCCFPTASLPPPTPTTPTPPPTGGTPLSYSCYGAAGAVGNCRTACTSTEKLFTPSSCANDSANALPLCCIPNAAAATPAPTQPGGGNTPPVQPGAGNTGPTVTLINPLNGGGTLEGFLASILAFVVRIGAIVVVLMLVYVGYLFVAAQGNESKLSDARRALLWTLIGALILLGAQAIAFGIQATVAAISAGH